MDLKLIFVKYLFVLFFLYSCSATKQPFRNEINEEKFKERTLCNCIALGLDSNRNNPAIQRLIPYNPIARALFDSVIIENLQPVFGQIYLDSLNKVGRKTEAAQGKS